MTSNWQHVDVPIVGLNTTRDPKLGPAGRLLKLDNGWMDREGEIRQRNGFTLLPTAIQERVGGAGSNAAAPYDCVGVAKRSDRLMAAFRWAQAYSFRGFYEYSPSGQMWNTAQLHGAEPEASRVEVQRLYEIASTAAFADRGGVLEECDCAISGNFLCIGYSLTSSGTTYVGAKIVDVTTGAIVLDDEAIGGNPAARPRVIAYASNPWRFAVFYNTGANLDQVGMTTFLVTSATEADVVASYTNLANAAGTNGRSNYDVYLRSSTNDIVLAWANWDGVAATYFPQWRSVDPATGATGAIVTGTATAGTTAVGEDSRVTFGGTDSTTVIYLFMRGTTSGLKQTNITSATLAQASTTVIDAAATAAARNNAQCVAFYDASWGREYVALRGALGQMRMYAAGTARDGATWGSPQSRMYGERSVAGGHTIPWVIANSAADDPTAYVTRFQNFANNSLPAARLDVGANGFAFSGGFEWPCSLAVHSTGIFTVVPVVRSRAVAGAQYESYVSLYVVRIVNRSDVLSNVVNALDAAFIPGIVRGFDGLRSTPMGVQPAARYTVALFAGAGGLTASSTYKYRFVVVANIGGRDYRSPPSLPVSFTLGVGQTATTITAVPQMSGQTARSLRVEIYRTTAGGDTYYRVKDLWVLPWGSTTTYQDTATTDAQLVTNELLYATGTVLEDYPAPNAKHLAAWGNRMFAVSAEFPNRVYFTKTFVDGVGPGWNPALYVEAADEYGDFVAVAATDRALIAFKANAIYAITGDGPDNTGQGAFAIQQIATGIGCNNDASVVATPQGLMFKGSNGLNFLDRGYAASYVGRPVAEYVDATTIVGSCVLPAREMACWVASNGHVYVWDWGSQQWSRWITPATNCVGCCEYQGTLVVADVFGRIYQETINQTYDHGTTTAQQNPINLDFTFAPIALNGFAGFERLRELQLLGQRDGDCTVTVTVRYDYLSTNVQQLIATVTAASGHDKLMRVKVNRQKASAFEVNVRVTFATFGAGYRFSGMCLEIASKRSLNKRHGSAV